MRLLFQKLIAMKSSCLAFEGKQFLGTVLLTILAVGVIFGEVLVGSYNATEELALQTSTSIGALVDQDIARNFELLNLSLNAVAEGLANPKLMALEPPLRQEALFHSAAETQALGYILVLNENGDAVLDSRSTQPPDINFADRDYFQIHKSSMSASLHVSQPLQSRLRNGEWIVVLSRRLSHPDGSFAGVVLSGLRLNYFQTIFQKVAVRKDSSVKLISEDGLYLARYPNVESTIGQKVAWQTGLLDHYRQSHEGSFENTGLDGIQRIYNYHKIAGLPLILSIGLSREEIFGEWRRGVIVHCISILVLFFLIIVLALRVEQELRRRKQVEHQLESLASTDPLTGLANRRKFDETLQFEWARARRSGLLFSMLMVDVDFFKSYNDQFGHQEGDEALKAIANCLRSTLKRPADLAARYGGEEFAVLLPNTDETGARYIAEMMRASVEQLKHPCLKNASQKLTVSIGIGSLYPVEEDDAVKLLREADRALYIAKASGRNCVHSSRAGKVSLVADTGTGFQSVQDLANVIEFKKDLPRVK